MNAKSTDQEFTGKFCWDEIEGVAVPFIIRSRGEMMAEINMLRRTLFRKHLEVLSESLFKIACPPKTQRCRVTDSEGRLLDEINAVHCDYYFGRKRHTSDTFLLAKDQVIKLHQVLELFYKVVTERSIENPKCGYILIDESKTPVPFVDVDGLGLVVPLFFFECPAVMHIKIELEDHWPLVYLKLFCKLLSVCDVFYNHQTLMVVKLDRLKEVIPEAGQLTFITTLPSNLKVSEIAKRVKPLKRKCLNSSGVLVSHKTKRPSGKLNNLTTTEIIILNDSDPENTCDSTNTLEMITIQIEKDEDSASTHSRKIVRGKMQVREKQMFRKILPLLPKPIPSEDDTNSKESTNNKQSKSKPNKCSKKSVHSNHPIDSNNISKTRTKADTLTSREQDMEVKQSKQVGQNVPPHIKIDTSADGITNNQSNSHPNVALVKPVCYTQLMNPNATSAIGPEVNTLTSCHQDIAVKPIQISNSSLGNFQTCVTQTENTPLEQNLLPSNPMLLPSLPNNNSSCTPCFGFLSQAPGIMNNDFLQANPPLVLSGTNNSVYVLAPQTAFINGLASSPATFLAAGQVMQPIVGQVVQPIAGQVVQPIARQIVQPIELPSFQKPNETHSIIGTQDQPVATNVQQTAAPPSSVHVGIPNSVVILQQQGQNVVNHKATLPSNIDATSDTVQQVGLLPHQNNNVSQQNEVFLAAESTEIAIQSNAHIPKDLSTLSNKNSHTENEFITVFEKDQEQFWVLKSTARDFQYKINKIPEYVSLKGPFAYRIQKVRHKNTLSEFLCISSSPFDTGHFLINIFEFKEKLFPTVDKTLFLIAAFNMKLELFYLNSSQRAAFVKLYRKLNKNNPREELYTRLDKLSEVYKLMSDFFKMAKS